MQLRRGNLVALGDPGLPKACPAAPPSEVIFHPAHACWIEQPRAPQRAMHFLVAKPKGSHGQGATGTLPGCNLKQEAKLTAARERLWGHEAQPSLGPSGRVEPALHVDMRTGVETYADVARETHHLSWINPESLRSPSEPMNPMCPFIQMQKLEAYGGPQGPALV